MDLLDEFGGQLPVQRIEKEIEHFRMVCRLADVSGGSRVRENGIPGFENRPCLPFREGAALNPFMVEHERDDRSLVHAIRDAAFALGGGLFDIAADKLPL